VKWATRAGAHIDRAASAWLIRRHIDADAQFTFFADQLPVPADATPFDMRGVLLGQHGRDCTFEAILRRYDIADPVLWKLAEMGHEADIDDERYDAPRRRQPMPSSSFRRDVWGFGDSSIVAGRSVTGPQHAHPRQLSACCSSNALRTLTCPELGGTAV